MVSRVLKALTAKDSNDEAQSWDKQTALIVLGNYFSPDKKTAGGPTQQEIVVDVLTNMVYPPGKTPGTGSALFIAMTIGNGLDEESCSAKDADGKPSSVAAYTVSGGNCGTSIYFCDNDRVNPFKYPDLSGLPTDAAQCKKTFKDGKVSYKMAPLAYILIHELTHTLEVSELPFKKAKVTDKLQATDDPAYGPQKVRALRDKPENGRYAATKDVLLGPIENADSYAWFVVEAYFSLLCHERFGAPTSNQMAPDGVCANGPDKCTLM
ncbi:uncharacterized protein N7458_006761 [Penicillium daleae]|uniref:Lysine-specific metallo-endopeptidase domain-containing protein n=1 Tax=Penicillium daleae TaxID=63821 RepID=A0AAD6G200_9EURO|nr:uncharacterized protein N7458_006761 [Penicillium daleae]KAJ5450312.1 hypothetical protein N7458_006761 [Penicillium daleae]